MRRGQVAGGERTRGAKARLLTAADAAHAVDGVEARWRPAGVDVDALVAARHGQGVVGCGVACCV